jgi:hypothetical protein
MILENLYLMSKDKDKEKDSYQGAKNKKRSSSL